MTAAARAVLRGGAALAGGAAVGILARTFAAAEPGPHEVAAAAMTAVLAGAAVVAAGTGDLRAPLGSRLRSAGFAGLLAGSCGAAAGVTAGGGAGALGAATVVAGISVLARGLAAGLERAGVGDANARFLAAGVALAPAALVFVADPWIDWRAELPEGGAVSADVAASPGRAALVLRVNPIAAMTSRDGGLGVDWQRMPWMYDGPAPGVPGLSLVGQFYPAEPATPFAWGGVALLAGAALVALAGRQEDERPG